MKRKLNLVLAAVLLGIMGTAVASCYLEQVVVCRSPGTIVGSDWKYCSGLTYSFDILAYEYAYKLGVYTVGSGGSHSYLTAAYCDRYNSGTGHPSENGYFTVYYIDPCDGTQQQRQNGPLPSDYQFTFNWGETDGTTCP
jgi:hypothetical protein